MFAIPHGDDVITIQLTVKEAIALGTGEKFPKASYIAASARSKVKRQVTDKLLSEGSVSYESLMH